MQTKKINFATAYRSPIHAHLDGRPVKILATGDVEGMSPSFQYVDENGKVDWQSADRFIVTDQYALPQGASLSSVLSQASRQTSSTSSSPTRETVGSTSR